jgi:hypothetical protein
LIKLLGSRGAAAVMGFLMLALGSSEAAAAQDYSKLNVEAAVRSLDTDVAAKPLGQAVAPSATPAPVAAVATQAVTTAISTVSGSVTSAAPSIAKEAAWLHQGGWPLYALVDKFATSAQLDPESTCLATAVYFEARGESLEGQLAVARVVMNRAASGKYPPSWCATVKQPAQFSFVQHGRFPPVNVDCAAWRKAQAIAELAEANVVPSVSNDVLWYHADYVSPAWGPRLERAEKIGQHIFYRA